MLFCIKRVIKYLQQKRYALIISSLNQYVLHILLQRNINCTLIKLYIQDYILYLCTSVRYLLRVGTWQLQHVFISSSAQGRHSFAHVSSFTPAMFHKIMSTAARTTTSVRKIKIAIKRMLANSDIFTAISWTSYVNCWSYSSHPCLPVDNSDSQSYGLPLCFVDPVCGVWCV